MQLELEKKDGESIGALLKLINNSRLLDDTGQPLTGKMAIAINTHLGVVLNLYNRIMKAEDGGLNNAKVTEEKKPKKKRGKKEKKLPPKREEKEGVENGDK